MSTVGGGVKTEDPSYSTAIKRDPALSSPPPSDDDDDKYVADDDEGELSIPGHQDENHVWLAKLPKWLWEAWADIGDDEEIEIGKLRIYHPKEGREGKVKMILHDLPNGEHAKVPKNYNLILNKQVYNNTVVFSEKDQQGFKSWRPNRVFKKDNRRDQYRPPPSDNRVNKHKKYSSAIPSMSLHSSSFSFPLPPHHALTPTPLQKR